ncbi:MAG TPA: diaminopimelate epimerase [Cytophagaceae bacterium]|jgi:diaminopimelate epimerase
MTLKFYKYQGTGNDFILIDNRTAEFDSQDTELVKKLCDRRYGIGADGLILLEDCLGFDFQMVYFNSDGNQSSMCGNGGRCIVQFAKDMGVIKKETTFRAIDGEHDAFIENELVHLKMIDVSGIERIGNDFYLNTGSPHYVKAVENIKDFAVYNEGYAIRNNDRFRQEGTNVNFVEPTSDALWVRTFERGVEDETYSCGTGVTAAALASSFNGAQSPVKIKTLGGDLQVSFKKEGEKFTNIYLVGPAKQVFRGSVEV